jgi:hypothetical protein
MSSSSSVRTQKVGVIGATGAVGAEMIKVCVCVCAWRSKPLLDQEPALVSDFVGGAGHAHVAIHTTCTTPASSYCTLNAHTRSNRLNAPHHPLHPTPRAPSPSHTPRPTPQVLKDRRFPVTGETLRLFASERSAGKVKSGQAAGFFGDLAHSCCIFPPALLLLLAAACPANTRMMICWW